MVEAEALFQLSHLAGQRGRIGGAAGEHLDRHRTTVAGAQQAVDDLPFAALAVPAVAELGKRTAAPFHIAGRDVVEHQRAAAEMALGQRRLDRWLAHRQPVERAVEFVFVDHAQAELFAQARGRGVRRQRAGGGQLGAGLDQAADDECQDEVAAAVARGTDEPVEADPARRAERRLDMTVRQGADDGDGVLALGNNGAAFEQRLEAGDPLVRPVGQVQQRTLFDPAGLAVALAQQDGRGRTAIGDSFDIHGRTIAADHPPRQPEIPVLWRKRHQCRQATPWRNCLIDRRSVR